MTSDTRDLRACLRTELVEAFNRAITRAITRPRTLTDFETLLRKAATLTEDRHRTAASHVRVVLWDVAAALQHVHRADPSAEPTTIAARVAAEVTRLRRGAA